MKKTGVLVIDDSAYNRKTITDMLHKSPGIDVVGVACDGEEGLKKALKLKPDIITLDLEMPVMDGFTFLRILMVNMPTPVVVVSARDDDVNVFKALELGAVDFLAKPTARISKELLSIEKDLLSKVRMVSELKMDNLQKRVASHKTSHVVCPGREVMEQEIQGESVFAVAAIGSSTGGPPALQSIFSSLPKKLPLSVVVSQHMPPGFTKAFSQRLNRLSDFEVKEAEDGDRVERGKALIAPGGSHMLFDKVGDETVVKICKRSNKDMYAPSVDKMFMSAAEVFEKRVIGVVLTGMGNDGKNGVKRINKFGGTVIAESEETSIVYGMPREAVGTGVVDKVLPLGEIAEEIVGMCGNYSENKG